MRALPTQDSACPAPGGAARVGVVVISVLVILPRYHFRQLSRPPLVVAFCRHLPSQRGARLTQRHSGRLRDR